MLIIFTKPVVHKKIKKIFIFRIWSEALVINVLVSGIAAQAATVNNSVRTIVHRFTKCSVSNHRTVKKTQSSNFSPIGLRRVPVIHCRRRVEFFIEITFIVAIVFSYNMSHKFPHIPSRIFVFKIPHKIFFTWYYTHAGMMFTIERMSSFVVREQVKIWIIRTRARGHLYVKAIRFCHDGHVFDTGTHRSTWNVYGVPIFECVHKRSVKQGVSLEAVACGFFCRVPRKANAIGTGFFSTIIDSPTIVDMS
mmetsp:Transcript_44020/g.64677  ORF Transcript_44020/g.64677 Transcript_44020/m.64677 type:complete len:250 (+) Transcript_44020:402-1151(+)